MLEMIDALFVKPFEFISHPLDVTRVTRHHFGQVLSLVLAKCESEFVLGGTVASTL